MPTCSLPGRQICPSTSRIPRNARIGTNCEICENYDIDGVHIDDYFYPTTDESFDAVQYAACGGVVSLADWRRENCTLLVKGIYSAVKSAEAKPAAPCVSIPRSL